MSRGIITLNASHAWQVCVLKIIFLGRKWIARFVWVTGSDYGRKERLSIKTAHFWFLLQNILCISFSFSPHKVFLQKNVYSLSLSFSVCHCLCLALCVCVCVCVCVWVPLSLYSSLRGSCLKGHTDFIFWSVILCSKRHWSSSICFLTRTL